MTVPGTTPEVSLALPAGYRLSEYQIESVLGQGGFGITYLARDTKLGAEVAIKEYFPQVFARRIADSTIVPRTGDDHAGYQWGLDEFLKEAQALAKFKHPHIVRVLRFLEANGTAYMVMEYEQGENLSTFIGKHGGFLDEPTLLRVFLPILTGLQAVHDEGLLHLDIKAGNIYMRTDGEPMLIDFGSSRQIRGEGAAADKVMLTKGFCALEQYPGHGEVGPWSDVYSMGATLYRCITARSPVDSLERHQTLGRTSVDPLRPASSFERPRYSAHIRKCIDLALNLSSSDRPPSAHALQLGLMGQDMTQAAKPVRNTMFRFGSGFIGILPAALKPEKHGRRYSFFEKLTATIVLIATYIVVVPSIMLDTGRLTEKELFDWIDGTRDTVTTSAREFGETINERVFGKLRREKPVVAARPRLKPVVETPVVVAPEPPKPYGMEKQKVLEFPVMSESLRTLGLLKHGTVLVTAALDGAVRLWDAQTGEARKTLDMQLGTAALLCAFPSQQWFVIGDRKHRLVIYDPLGNIESVLQRDKPDPIAAIAVSSGDRLLAEATEDGTVTVRDISANRAIRVFPPSGRGVQSLAFSPDERWILAGYQSGELIRWDIGSGERLSALPTHKHAVSALAFSPDGRWLASATSNGELRLTSLIGDPVTRELVRAPAGARALQFSPDSLWLLAGGDGGGIRVWDMEHAEPAHEIATGGRDARTFSMTRDGRMLAIGDDAIARIWK